MKSTADFSPESFSLVAEEDAHALCRRFEQALRGGHPLTVDALLKEIAQTSRPLALYELVKIDAEFRQNRGEQPTPTDYPLSIECPDAKSAILSALQAAEKLAPRDPLDNGDGPQNQASQDSRVGGRAPSLVTMPRKLGRYSISGRLGRGGMGTVFKAFDNRLKRFVALKIPHFDKTGDVSIRERFRREALALAALSHDTIVAVHDVARSGDYEFMTMALIEGETLRRYIHKGRPLAQHHAAILVRALAKAMQYVHESGVIHRDLKPENVIMEDGRKPVIVDFGLARSPGASDLPLASVPADLGRHVTRFGQVAGTPEYSSPEQLAGDFDAIGPQTDIYSLGVILFELLTGRLPWEGENGSESPDQASEGPNPHQACDLNLQVDRSLSDICGKAMEPILEHRFRSMTDFAEALRPFCQTGAQRRAGQESADSNTDQSIDAVLQEIARQASRNYTRPAEKIVPQKRPLARLAIALLVVVGIAALFIELREPEGRISKSAQAPQKITLPKSPSTARRTRIEPNRRPRKPEFFRPKQDEPHEPPVEEAAAKPAPSKPERIAAAPKESAHRTPLPAWHSAVKQIIDGGGKVSFEIPGIENEWQRKWVDKVRGIPTQPQTRIIGVVLARPKKSRDYLADLRQILKSFPTTLTSLKLTGVPLDEATISNVAELPSLRQLVLRDAGLSGSLWEELSRGSFKSLRRIDLGGNQIDPSALDLMLTRWEQTAAPLESIGFAGARAIGKQDLERMARFPKLAELDFADAAIAPAALAQLSAAKGLTTLTLAGVPLPDGSVSFLDGLHDLEYINLARTPLSDETLPDLARAAKNLSRLKLIEVQETRFSSAGILAMANLLGKRGVAAKIMAGERLDFGYRTEKRRELAMQHFQADSRVEPAISAGIDWLVRYQQGDGLWSLIGPYPNGAAKEDRLEASALALLVLQGHGYDGLGKGEFHRAVRRGYRGLGLLVQNSDRPSELGPYGSAIAAFAVCDLHAMAGFRLQENSHLPQQTIVEGILASCRELQRDDGGWGEKARGDALLTGWYVQVLTSAEAAGFKVDSDILSGAKKFLQELWRADIKRYIYQYRNRRESVLGSHGAAVTSLQLINRMPLKLATNVLTENHKEAVQDPYFCYYGTRSAIDTGGDLWKLWNRNVLAEKLCVGQTGAGPERGSWLPSPVSDEEGPGCSLACGRFYATCLNLLALEAFYRQLPLNAPVEFRVIETEPSE
ncbi:protein kinase [Pirellulales bacterium]|nr:protein kinase [Pirellulales bacterium]